MTTRLTNAVYTLPAASLNAENPLPIFRAPAPNQDVTVHPSLPDDKRRYLGWQAGYRVLPYRMQDQYNRKRRPRDFQAVILENEFLRAIFLPELGGRLVSLVWLPEGRELLHRNPVFQPADLAIRNAWFSGGVEWNIGQFGHTFTTCSPVFAAEIAGPGGEPGLRLYEFERCKQLFWQIDFYLPPGFPFLAAYVRVINPNNKETSMYWWTNIAVNEAPDVRVLASADEAIYMDVGSSGACFGYTRLPGLPSLNGKDGTYATNSPFANEFFFQCDDAPMPWEAALDGEGRGLVEASTPRLRYRKMFCWGMHRGGRHWQEFLSQPGEGYVEIQAGLAPTQLHGLPMPAQTAWDWTQIFGYLAANPQQVHSPDWNVARQEVEHALQQNITASRLADLEQTLRALAGQVPRKILYFGSGWGALELHRRSAAQEEPLPGGYIFPVSTLGVEQQKWLALLYKGILPPQDPTDLPGEWMIQPEWEALVKSSLERQGGRHWLSLLHLGVMRMEQFDLAGARAAWEESLHLAPSAWAYRNLAVLALRQEKAGKALDLYAHAWELLSNQENSTLALATEYLQALVQTGSYARGDAFFRSLPPQIQEADRIQILHGWIALALGDLAAVESVLARDFAVIREGESSLTELWFEMRALQETGIRWKELAPDVRRDLTLRFPPPAEIDFRSAE